MLEKLNPESHLFVFDDVPLLMKLNGRAVQIPEGFPYAGNWMIRSGPMSQDDPWKALKGAPKTGASQTEIVLGGPPKVGFIETHGELPADSIERRIWKDAHPAFVKAGLPDEYLNSFDTAALLAAAEPEATFWGFGPAKPYVNKFGGFVRFPKSEVPSFEVPIWTWLFDADQVGATYQMRWALKFNKAPMKWHPGVPDVFRKAVAEGVA